MTQTTENNIDATTKPSATSGNDTDRNPRKTRPPRVVSNPSDVASLVLLQIDAVNAKKDELTLAVKNLTDTAKQLVRAYAGHTRTIARLRRTIEELEKKAKTND